mmetsp:Transcript_3987/g.5966  ORF Transcript_3987/g.5966 Transcript_3987/m.5966 type:complete len:88 (-) Transcript_3987:611-874(-)
MDRTGLLSQGDQIIGSVAKLRTGKRNYFQRAWNSSGISPRGLATSKCYYYYYYYQLIFVLVCDTLACLLDLQWVIWVVKIGFCRPGW